MQITTMQMSGKVLIDYTCRHCDQLIVSLGVYCFCAEVFFFSEICVLIKWKHLQRVQIILLGVDFTYSSSVGHQ